MVLVHELRILHPYTVAEFERGQTYGNLKIGEQLETSGQGSIMVSSDPYYDEVYGEGAFNRSVTKLGEGRLPAWATKLLTPGALDLQEKCWTVFPYCKTSVSVPAFQGLKCEVVSVQLQDRGTTENALNLPKDLLSKRTVAYIDIGASKIDPKDYREDMDPALFKSKLTGKGPLTPGWQERETPIMCAYKVIIAEFKYTGLQGRVERMLVSMMTNLFTMTHRACFCTIDEWYPLTTEQVLDKLDKKRQASGSTVVEHRRSSLAPSCLLSAGAAAGSAEAEAAEESESEGLSDVATSSDLEEDEDEEFLDAEVEWALEESMGESLSGASLLAPAPSECPFCVHTKKASLALPSLFCRNCDEFFCAACFHQVHVTPKLQQHTREELPDRAVPNAGALSSASISISVAGRVQCRVTRTAGYRRTVSHATSVSAAPGDSSGPAADVSASTIAELSPELTSSVSMPTVAGTVKGAFSSLQHLAQGREGASKRGGDEEVADGGKGEEEGTFLAWDKVKDPPLNVFCGVPAPALPPHFGDPESHNIALWLALLVGHEAEESFVEVPEELRQKPAEIAAAMIYLLASIYRSGSAPERPLPTSPFPLANFNPSWKQLSQYFPGFSDADADADADAPAASASAGAPTAGEKQQPGVVEVTTLPSPSRDRDLEMQRLEAARLYRALAEELIEVEPLGLKTSPAFWINAHNALVLHAYLVYGVPKAAQDLSMLLQKASFIIGGVRFSAAAIEETILRPHDGSRLGISRVMAGLPRVLNLREAKLFLAAYAVNDPNALVPFALSVGTASSPTVSAYHDDNLEAELKEAAKEYLDGRVHTEGATIRVPSLFFANRRDIGKRVAEQVGFLKDFLPHDKAGVLLELASQRLSTRKIFDPIPDDLQFKYTFSTSP